jgi:thiol-disulfide isomerase/thioredoxin
MKYFFVVLAMTVLLTSLQAQPHFETLTERPQEKSLKGFLDRATLQADSSFKWFTENYSAYSPHKEGLASFKQHKDSVQLLVFMGTWCEDSHFIIPRLYAMIDAAGFNEKQLTLMGADRSKQSWGGIMEALSVKNVPTIIVYHQGKELGRIIEYGKYGQFDREMGEIIKGAFKQ